MGAFQPSEVARLVLGYLEEQGCTSAYDEFLVSCRYLEECFFPRVAGLSLTKILDDYGAVHSFVSQLNYGEEYRRNLLRCQTLLDKIKVLADHNHSSSRDNTRTDKLLLSNSLSRKHTKSHRSRHIRSNSCGSIVTVVDEKCGDGNATPAHLVRSMESLAEATKLADLPGNKKYSNLESHHRNLNDSCNKTTSNFSKPSSSVLKSRPNADYSQTLVKETQKPRSRMDADETEFRRALGLMKLPDSVDVVSKTPLKAKPTANKKHSLSLKKTPLASDSQFINDSLDVTKITSAFLDCTELHEKLAENINTIYNMSKLPEEDTQKSLEQLKDMVTQPKEVNNEVVPMEEDVPQLDTVIKTIVDKTEKDPLFDQLVTELLVGSAGHTSSGTDSDVISRPGTSTPEKSSYSQVNESSPTHSWEFHENQHYQDKYLRHHSNFRKSHPTHNDKIRLHLNISHKHDPHSKIQYNSSRYKKYPRYPRGGKRMDILRENYRNSCDNDDIDADSIPALSTESNSPTETKIPSPKESPVKPEQKVIILSNEVVHLASKGPFALQKITEDAHNLPDSMISREQTLVVPLSQPTDVVNQPSNSHFGRKNILSPPPPVTLIRSFNDPRLQSSSHIHNSLSNKVNNPLVLKTIPAFETKVENLKKDYPNERSITEISPINVPVTPSEPLIVKTVKLSPVKKLNTEFPASEYVNSYQSKPGVGCLQLRKFRKTTNIVSGKPLDLVISNGQVMNQQNMRNNYFSEADIMKMPTIFLPSDSYSVDTDLQPCVNNSNVNTRQSTEGSIPIVSTEQVQCKKPVQRTRKKRVAKEPSKNINVVPTTMYPIKPVNILPKMNYLKDVSILGLENQPTKLIPVEIQVIGTNSSPKKLNEWHNSVKTSFDLTWADANVDNKPFITFHKSAATSVGGDSFSTQSYVSSEDDRFVIDEGQKSSLSSSVLQSKEIVCVSEIKSEIDLIEQKPEMTDIDKIEAKKKTPDLMITTKTSLSSPKRFSHVRVLDFNTPAKNSSNGARKAHSSPKMSSRGFVDPSRRPFLTPSTSSKPKAQGIKSRLFPTIIEKTSEECIVSKPNNVNAEVKSESEVIVSEVWDEVQGMGQIIKEDVDMDKKSIVENKDEDKKSESNTKKKKNPKKNGSKSDQCVEPENAITKEEKKQIEAIAGAEEWNRIRNMNKKTWDQEIRSIVASSETPVIKVMRSVKKIKRKKIGSATHKLEDIDELSKSTEDEGKMLENALNKSPLSTPAKDSKEVKGKSTKQGAKSDSAIDTDCNVLPLTQENSFIKEKNMNLEVKKELTGEQVEYLKMNQNEYSTEAKFEQGKISNKDYLLQVKLFRDAVREQTIDASKSTNNSKLPDSECKKQVKTPKCKSTFKVKMISKNCDENNSDKDDIVEILDENIKLHSSSIMDKGLGHFDVNKEHFHNDSSWQSNMAGPCGSNYNSKNLEPPVPSIKITPDMPREHDFNPLSAKCNLASLLDTPFKSGILDLHMETPKFISPGFYKNPLSSLKVSDIPTPSFQYLFESGTTPKTIGKECTPGSYSSRPTDYSSSSSYYKPDEIEFNIDIKVQSRNKKSPIKTLPPLPEEDINLSQNNESLSQRVLRPRGSPKNYYKMYQIGAKNTSSNNSKNTSLNKSGTDSAIVANPKTPAKLTTSKSTSKNISKSSNKGTSAKKSGQKSKSNEDVQNKSHSIKNAPLKSDVDTDSSTCSSCPSSVKGNVNSGSEPLTSESSDGDSPTTCKTSTPKKVSENKTNNLGRESKSSESLNSSVLNKKQLEEKRRRVIAKLRNSGNKKKVVCKTKMNFISKRVPGKIVLNRNLSLKNNTKRSTQNRNKSIKIESPPNDSKIPNVLEKSVKLSVGISKSRRKSSTPRKLTAVVDAVASILDLAHSQLDTNTITKENETIKLENHIKEKIDVLEPKIESAVDTVKEDDNCMSGITLKECSSINLESEKNEFLPNKTIESTKDNSLVKIPDKLKRLYETSPTSNNDNSITLHLSSDEAEMELCKDVKKSQKPKVVDDSYDIYQIEDFISKSSKESEKTPFQKNLEIEGFDEISAKAIEMDLTDSIVKMDNMYTVKKHPLITSEKSVDICVQIECLDKKYVKATKESESINNTLTPDQCPDLTDVKSKVIDIVETTKSPKISTKNHHKFHYRPINKSPHRNKTPKKNKTPQKRYTPQKHTTPEKSKTPQKYKSPYHTNLTPKGKKSFPKKISLKDYKERKTNKETIPENKNENQESLKTEKCAPEISNPTHTESKLLQVEKKEIGPSGLGTHTESKLLEVEQKEIMELELCEKSEDRRPSGLGTHTESKLLEVEQKEIMESELCEKSEDRGPSGLGSSDGVFTVKQSDNFENPSTVTEHIEVLVNEQECENDESEENVVWTRHELNSSSDNFINIVYKPPLKQKKKKPKSPEHDLTTFRMNVSVYNSTSDADEVRCLEVTQNKELLETKPDHCLYRRIKRLERNQIKKQELEKQKDFEEVNKNKTPVGKLLHDVSNTNLGSVSPLKTIDETIKDKHSENLLEKNERETELAVESILEEDNTHKSPFFYTPIKYSLDPLHSSERVNAACDSLKKNIIEDQSSDENDMKKQFLLDLEVSPSKDSQNDDLMNFAVSNAFDNLRREKTATCTNLTEKRKRIESDEGEEMSNKKTKMSAEQILLEKIGIESVLSKIYGPSSE